MRAPAKARSPRPRVTQNAQFPAPVGGWIANRSKALPRQPNQPPGALVLENWFPTATGIKLRRGTRRHATVGVGEDPVFSLFTYTVGTQEQLFACTMTTIYDVTNITVATPMEIGVGDDDVLGTGEPDESLGEPADPGVVVRTGLTNGNWVVCPIRTDAGTFLRGVNGADTPWVYDGAAFGTTPALTFEAGETAEPRDLSYVWSFKSRLFFIRKDTMDAYYLPVNQIGGELSVLPLGSIFPLGGSLLFGASWSLGTSSAGGLSAQCIFVTTEGEVAVYQGSNPDSIDDWSLVGVYRIGKPLGKQAFIRAGGDIIIATTIGLLPLSSAVQLDYAALAGGAVSNPIEEAWKDAVQRRGPGDWQCITWPDEAMVMVAPPDTDGQNVLVANSSTGAWCRFTGFNPRCFATWRGGLYFGADGGQVVQFGVTGSDQGDTYTGRYMGLYDDQGTAAQRKIAMFGRPSITSTVGITPGVSVVFDWDVNFPAAPNAEPAQVDSVWDGATWDQARWDSENLSVSYEKWTSVGGSGARMAPVLQITSGSSIPIDAEMIAFEITYSVAEIVT